MRFYDKFYVCVHSLVLWYASSSMPLVLLNGSIFMPCPVPVSFQLVGAFHPTSRTHTTSRLSTQSSPMAYCPEYLPISLL